jgi:opacity protein-like surface antigen
MTRLNKLSLALLVVSAGLTQPALAAAPGTFYLGGAIGSASNDYSTGKCNDDSLDVRYYIYTQTNLITECKIKSSGDGFKLMAGYNITPNFAIEGAYDDLGKITADLNDIYSGSTVGSVEQKTTAVTIDGVGNFPLGNGFVISGKIGFYSASQKSTDDMGDDDTTKASSGLHLGASAGYAFNHNLSARVEYERFSDVGATNVSDNFMNYKAPTFKSNIDLVSVGLIYNY